MTRSSNLAYSNFNGFMAALLHRFGERVLEYQIGPYEADFNDILTMIGKPLIVSKTRDDVFGFCTERSSKVNKVEDCALVYLFLSDLLTHIVSIQPRKVPKRMKSKGCLDR